MYLMIRAFILHVGGQDYIPCSPRGHLNQYHSNIRIPLKWRREKFLIPLIVLLLLGKCSKYFGGYGENNFVA